MRNFLRNFDLRISNALLCICMHIHVATPWAPELLSSDEGGLAAWPAVASPGAARNPSHRGSGNSWCRCLGLQKSIRVAGGGGRKEPTDALQDVEVLLHSSKPAVIVSELKRTSLPRFGRPKLATLSPENLKAWALNKPEPGIFQAHRSQALSSNVQSLQAAPSGGPPLCRAGRLSDSGRSNLRGSLYAYSPKLLYAKTPEQQKPSALLSFGWSLLSGLGCRQGRCPKALPSRLWPMPSTLQRILEMQSLWALRSFQVGEERGSAGWGRRRAGCLFEWEPPADFELRYVTSVAGQRPSAFRVASWAWNLGGSRLSFKVSGSSNKGAGFSVM